MREIERERERERERGIQSVVRGEKEVCDMVKNIYQMIIFWEKGIQYRKLYKLKNLKCPKFDTIVIPL